MSISSVSTYGRSAEISSDAATKSRRGKVVLDTGNQAAAQTSEDVLDLSAEGQAAADAAPPQAAATAGSSLLGKASLFEDLGGTVKNGVVTFTIEGMETSLASAKSALQSKLDKAFADNNIDTSREIKLQIGYDGQVVVANDNPQRAAIEKIFKDDPSLRDAYAKVNRITEFIGSAKESLAFQEAYARDPYQAVAQYSYLFNSASKATASLSILGDRYQALFERPGFAPVEIGPSGDAQ